jgi:hypothetical protein
LLWAQKLTPFDQGLSRAPAGRTDQGVHEMGVLSFFRSAKRPAKAAVAALVQKPRAAPGARRSADTSLDRLEQQFGHEVAPAAARLREAVQWHRSGRKADAWAAFDALLADREVGGSAHVRPAVESEIYSRMRVCLEREGCFNPALTPAVLCYASRAKSYAVQGRQAELLALRSPEFFDRFFMPLLERARLQHAIARLRSLVEEQLKSIPMVDLHALREKIESFRLNPPELPRPVEDRRQG